MIAPHISMEELVEGCRQNSVQAQTELYRRYAKGMYHVALRIVKNERDAEDVMQEGMMKAFEKMNQFRQEVPFGAWLKRIMVNQSIDWYKKNKLNTWEDVETTLYITPDETEDDILDNQQIKVQEVLEALNRLKDNYRMIVTLIFIEGYDQEEVCEILNISSANCRTLLSRAKEQLRVQLNNKTK